MLSSSGVFEEECFTADVIVLAGQNLQHETAVEKKVQQRKSGASLSQATTRDATGGAAMHDVKKGSEEHAAAFKERLAFGSQAWQYYTSDLGLVFWPPVCPCLRQAPALVGHLLARLLPPNPLLQSCRLHQ